VKLQFNSLRERQVAALLLEGAQNQEIAKRLGFATRTIKSDMSRMFKRFGISGRMKRVKLAVILFRAQRAKGESRC
jgi:DNA-binding CsgD family transcriptional regulator